MTTEALAVPKDTVRAVQWIDDAVCLLDQRRLPCKEAYVTLHTARQVADGITDMIVRGAPAIGITAAYGVVLAARDAYAKAGSDWRQVIESDLIRLSMARPTAVNLNWALGKMRAAFEEANGNPEGLLLAEARAIHEEDIAANLRMGELGASLLKARAEVVTHCNAGSLATGGFGTALGVIRTAYARGNIKAVYVGETRPWLQGARLTAWELVKDNIPISLLVDGAVASLMKSKPIDAVIVGADRIAANGDVANKIGTYGLALAARAHDVQFIVVAPTSTIDLDTASGHGIPVEHRSPTELVRFGDVTVAAPGTRAWNPVFDVTPAQLIDAIVTERGIVAKPDLTKIAALLTT